MIRKFLTAGMILLLLSLIPCTVPGQSLKAESEENHTRLEKNEIIKLMIQVDRLPAPEQNRKIEEIWANQSNSKTPRSDFLFCSGLAYLGNYSAQACLGRAYEDGIGIVQDPSEAYVWYSIALDNPGSDEGMKQKIRAERERIKLGLISMYPAPSDEELANLVDAQKHRMMECRTEAKNTRR